ncbi:bile acid:sodium symporter family protein [Trueperella sp. LYQ143]|uniref:bile acid:sodium symporter family protein n=1 Tax=unclassified Trueperella TaxID=2630174 RepID=UPI0039838573
MREAQANVQERSALIAVTLFPLIIVSAAIWGYFFPATAQHLSPIIAPGLGFIMFTMGLTLTLHDFALVAQRPVAVVLGVAAQYLIMPLAAVAVARVLNLPSGLAIGVILVGCCPGGTASNVVTYLARADVALSVTLTSVTTLLAPVMTPLLIQLLAGEMTDINAGHMARSIATTVVIPVLGGVLLRWIFPRVITWMLPILPWISTIGISIVVAALVPPAAPILKQAVGVVIIAVVAHNLLGLVCGYFLAKSARFSPYVARTVAIEVGMQNSGLAATLAKTHFVTTPEAALPAVIFSVWHNISGAIFSWWSRYRDTVTPAH